MFAKAHSLVSVNVYSVPSLVSSVAVRDMATRILEPAGQGSMLAILLPNHPKTIHRLYTGGSKVTFNCARGGKAWAMGSRLRVRTRTYTKYGRSFK